MLVLSRKKGEVIHIGETITITITDIDRGKVRIGITCPRDIPIHRAELLPLSPPVKPSSTPEGGS